MQWPWKSNHSVSLPTIFVQRLVQISSAVQYLSSSQDLRGRRCATLTFDLVTLKVFPAMRTHIMNICVKFYWNPPYWRGIHSREIGAQWMYTHHFRQTDEQRSDGRTDGRTTRIRNALCLLLARYKDHTSSNVRKIWVLYLENYLQYFALVQNSTDNLKLVFHCSGPFHNGHMASSIRTL